MSLLKMINFQNRTAALACVCALSFSTMASFPVAADQKTDDLLRHFESVVFGSEIDGVEGADYIQKWMSPVRVSMTSMQGKMLTGPGGKRELKLSFVPPDKAYVALVRKHLTTLVKVTGAKSEKSDEAKGKPANFMIKFVPRLAMGQPFLADDVDPAILNKLAQPGVCYFLTRSVSTGAMFRALIVVNNELPPAQMDACLLEEMTQAMGLPNDSDIISPSIFNQNSTAQSLSNSDLLLLKTLYDIRLPAGTPKVDAMRIGREILIEHLGG
ncbi:MAG: DUF2927 domain-containing protein [Rhodospirillales bacterium]